MDIRVTFGSIPGIEECSFRGSYPGPRGDETRAQIPLPQKGVVKEFHKMLESGLEPTLAAWNRGSNFETYQILLRPLHHAAVLFKARATGKINHA